MVAVAKPFAARVIEARARARQNGVRVYEVVPGQAYRCASQERPGVVYDLRCAGDGFACDCPGFFYTGVCKHIAQLERRWEREGRREPFRVARTAFLLGEDGRAGP